MKENIAEVFKKIPPQQCRVRKKFRIKGKGYPRTGHENPEGERGIALLFL